VIVGVCGYANSGKDTVGDALVERHGFVKVAWADPMRMMAERINPIVGWDPDSDQWVRYNDAVARVGYQQAKSDWPEIRRFLQRLGTEAGRGVLGDDVWVNATMARIEADHPGRDVVITDCRFANEADAVRAAGGVLVQVDRPGFEPTVVDHASERPWVCQASIVLVNEGTVDDLWYLVDLVVADGFDLDAIDLNP
jgi:hypothetical protein